MALSPRARLVLRILGIVVAVFALALVALPWLVSLDRFRAPLVSAAESALHRKVEVGTLRLQIWSGLGAGLENVVVHSKPGWTSPALLKAGRVSIKVAFLPLLARRIEVTKAVLEDGELTIERDPKGNLSVGLPGAETAGGRTAPKRSGTAADLLVSRIEVARGRLVFVDRKETAAGGFTLSMDDIKGEVVGVSPDSPAHVDIEARVLSDGAVRNLHLVGAAGPLPRDRGLGGAPLGVTVEGRNLLLGKLWPYLGLSKEEDLGRLALKTTLTGPLGGPHTLSGTISLAGEAVNADGQARFVGDWASSRYEVALDIPKFEARDSLSGSLSAHFELDAARRAAGEGELRIANLELRALDLMPEVARSLAAIAPVAGLTVPSGLQSTKFETLKARVRLAQGRVFTPGLTLSGKSVSANADGSVGLDRSLRYEGTVFLAPELARSLGDAGRYLADEQGRLPVPFQVSGDLTSPHVTVGEAQLLDVGRRVLGGVLRDFLKPPAPTPAR